jgi:ABC-type phosphate/phosphonate transport system substrate-binding protein
MIASLGMYDFGAAMAANDRLWALIRDGLRARGIDAPDALTRGEGAYWPAWEAPDLILSQTCGYPYRARLHDKVTLIGTPNYGLKDCPPGHYRSVIVAREGDHRKRLADFAGASFAYNESNSQSGWAALSNYAPEVLLGPLVRTGGHVLSAEAVRKYRADFAAIDEVTWNLLRGDLAIYGLRVIHRTPPTPGLPFITAAANDADLFFDCVAKAIAELAPQDRNTLRIQDLVRIPASAYLAVPNPPAPSEIAARN